MFVSCIPRQKEISEIINKTEDSFQRSLVSLPELICRYNRRPSTEAMTATTVNESQMDFYNESTLTGRGLFDHILPMGRLSARLTT